MIATGTELRRFGRARMARLAVVAMVLMPLLYGALYLWAFWNPPGHLDRMPVALVNEDTGATLDGTQVQAGDEVVHALLTDRSLGWREVDASTAEKGVKDGTYYFAVVVPDDFSTRVVSASGDDPQDASIFVTYDDANNFLSTTLGRSAMEKVQAAVRSQIGEQAVDRVLVGLGQARDGLANASDGAVKLSSASQQLGEGATTLQQGATTASQGAASLAQGTKQLAQGTSSLAEGAESLASGAHTLASGASAVSTGAGKLSTGVSDASSAAGTLADGAGTTQAGAKKVAKGAKKLDRAYQGKKGLVQGSAKAARAARSLSQGLSKATSQEIQLLQANVDALTAANATGAFDELIAKDRAMIQSMKSTGEGDVGSLVAGARSLAGKDGLPALSKGVRSAAKGTHKVAEQLSPSSGSGDDATVRDGVDQVASGSDALAGALDDAADAASTLAGGASDVSRGASTLATSADQVSAGATTVGSSVSTMRSGTTSLAKGTKKLSKGAGSLVTGASGLGDGADTLASQLADGAQQIPDDTDAMRTQRAQAIATPVTLQESDLAKASTFGEGMAPFFLSLALFVGAFVIWTLMRPLPPRALATPARGWRVAVGGYAPALVVGAAQVVALLAVVHYAVGLELTHLWGVLGFGVLVMAAFVAFQQMIIAVTGGAVGKVVIMAFLMLQLTTAGGLYPVETTGALFRALHPYLPMTYSVQGLRELITGGVDDRLWTSVAYLGGLLVVSLVITSWRAGRMRTWSLSRLHPAIAL